MILIIGANNKPMPIAYKSDKLTFQNSGIESFAGECSRIIFIIIS